VAHLGGALDGRSFSGALFDLAAAAAWGHRQSGVSHVLAPSEKKTKDRWLKTSIQVPKHPMGY